MNILIADDHPITLIGTKKLIESLGFKILDTCTNGIIAWNLIQKLNPDVAILDINMPGMDGIEILKKIKSLCLTTKVILLTMYNETILYRKAIEWGAYAYIPKEFSEMELKNCLHSLMKGKAYTSNIIAKKLVISSTTNESVLLKILSKTERKILKLVAQEKSSLEISELMFISERTVEGHRHNIIKKLKLPSENNILYRWAIKNRHLLLNTQN